MTRKRSLSKKVFSVLLAFLMVFGNVATPLSGVTRVYAAELTASDWTDLKTKVGTADPGDTIIIDGDMAATETISIDKNITIKAADGKTATIWSKPGGIDNPMFAVNSGTLTLGAGLTLSGKAGACEGEVVPGTFNVFRSNGATTNEKTATHENVAVDEALKYTPPADWAPESGYVFKGWKWIDWNGNEGSSVGSSDPADTGLKVPSNVPGTLTLIAQWEKPGESTGGGSQIKNFNNGYIFYVDYTTKNTKLYQTGGSAPGGFALPSNQPVIEGNNVYIDGTPLVFWNGVYLGSGSYDKYNKITVERDPDDSTKVYLKSGYSPYDYITWNVENMTWDMSTTKDGAAFIVEGGEAGDPTPYTSKNPVAFDGETPDTSSATGPQVCKEAEGCQTYSADDSKVGGDVAKYSSGGSIDNPRGFFVKVNNTNGGVTLAGATLRDFITDDSVKYVAPIAVVGGTFNMGEGSTIAHNSVGYVVGDNSFASKLPVNQIEDRVKGQWKRTDTAGAVILSGGATGTMSGGTVDGNRGDTGAFVVQGSGTENDYTGTLSSLLLTGGTVNNNVGVHYSGGIYIYNGAVAQMGDAVDGVLVPGTDNAKLTNNFSWYKGGAVYASEEEYLSTTWGANPSTTNYVSEAGFIMYGGEISGNMAVSRAGAIEVMSNQVVLLGGTISNNASRSLGGAIYVEGDGVDRMYTLVVRKGCITNNTAVGNVDNATLGRVFTKATTPAAGGCSFENDLGTSSVDATSIYDKRDYGGYYGHGGGIWLCSFGGNATFNISETFNVIVSNNTAAKAGQDVQVHIAKGGSPNGVNIVSSGNNSFVNEKTGEPLQAGTHYPGILSVKNTDKYTNQTCPAAGGVMLYNNVASNGGAIAANGTVVFGDDTDVYVPMSKARITKTWAAGVEHEKPLTFQYWLLDDQGNRLEALEGYKVKFNEVADQKAEGDEVGEDQYGENASTWEQVSDSGKSFAEMAIPWTVVKSDGTTVPTFTLKTAKDITINYTAANGKAKTFTGSSFDPSNPDHIEALWHGQNQKLFTGDYKLSIDKWNLEIVETGASGQEMTYKLGKEDQFVDINAFPATYESFYDKARHKLATINTYPLQFNFDTEVINGEVPEEPEIEKYVNQAVHSDIDFDEVFTYDIHAYITKDAKEVVITDTLNPYLDFERYNADGTWLAGDWFIQDIGPTNNHEVAYNVEGKPTEHEKTATVTLLAKGNNKPSNNGFTVTGIGGAVGKKIEDVTLDGGKTTKKMIVTISDASDVNGNDIRGHWVKIRFNAKIKEGTKFEDLQAAYQEVKGDAADSNRAEPNIGNAPVKAGATHTGVPNKAEYTINNKAEYSDTSNTVTVKPETVDLEITKVWEGDTAETRPDQDVLEAALKVQSVKGETVTDLNPQPKATITENDNNTWTVKWTGLKKLKDTSYQVAETQIAGYQAPTGSPAKNGETITNKKQDEEKPEIEKYVNQAVHSDIDFDEVFTYDILAYITKDAKEVVITDTLDKYLDFEKYNADGTWLAGDWFIQDIGPTNNHEVAYNVEGKPTEHQKTATVTLLAKGSNKPSNNGFTVTGIGAYVDKKIETVGNTKKMTVTINDASNVNGNDIRGHWVKIRFNAKIKEGTTLEDLKKAYQEVKGDAVDSNRKEPNKGNAPVKAGATHTGVPNKAEYIIDNKAEYKDTSNTVTVKPETLKLYAKKTYEITTPDLQGKFPINIDVKDTSGKVVDTIKIADANAIGESKELPKLSTPYTVEEQAIKGFTQVSRTGNGTKADPYVFTNKENDGKPVKVAFKTKKSMSDGSTPGTFTFELYTETDFDEQSGKVIAGATPLKTKDNTADGEVVFDAIEYGTTTPASHTYFVVERNTGEDGIIYDESFKKVTVTIGKDGDDITATVNGTKFTGVDDANVIELDDKGFVNGKEYSVNITKADLGGKELAGATIKVTGKDNNFNEEWTSTTEAHELKLQPGTYTMEEVVAPAGFQKVTTKVEFTVKADGTVEVTEAETEPAGKVKKDGNNGIILMDAPLEKPEIEKYVNKKDASEEDRDDTVHVDLAAFDEVYTYDIQAYIPNDATYVIVTDQLNEVLQFAEAEPTITAVVKKGGENGKAPALSDQEVFTPVAPATATEIKVNADAWKVNKLEVTMGSTTEDATVLPEAGYWLQITFDAMIKEEYKDLDSIKKAGATVWIEEPITVNEPIENPDEVESFSGSTGASHEGIINDSEYTVKRFGLKIDNKYDTDSSNTVTVQPETVKISAKKLWDKENATEWPDGVTIKVALKASNSEDAIEEKTITSFEEVTFTEQPKLEDVEYTVEEVSVEGIDNSVPVGEPTHETVNGVEVWTFTNTVGEIEKYVEKNVDATLKNPQEKFTFDVIGYVAKDATSVTITDNLVDALVLVPDSIKVQAQAANNHQVGESGTVNKAGTPITKFNDDTQDQNIVITIDDEEELANLRGNWVQLTFDATLSQAARDAVMNNDKDALRNLGFDTVNGNGTVQGGANEHDGFINNAVYTVGLPNEGSVEDESNTVTVEPSFKKLEIVKQWQDESGKVIEENLPTENVSVEILADGKSMNPQKIVELKGSENWTATIKYLPEYALGKDGRVPENAEPIKYTIKEISQIQGYTSTINDMTVVNKKSEEPEIEKYVNKDVHQDLGEFDRAFTYDIMTYVPENATKIVISDKLVAALEFANAGDDKAVKTTSPDEAVAAVVAKNSNDHTANSSVAGTPDITDITYNAAINGQDLTVTIDNIGSEEGQQDLNGKWIQVTFYAKYTQKVIDDIEIGVTKNVEANGVVVSETFPTHEGTVNQATYSIYVNNESTVRDEYKDIPSNEVTVVPETVKYEGAKSWTGEFTDENNDGWPDEVESVLFNLIKVDGNKREQADSVTLTAAEPSKAFKEQPKLIGVTYEVEEVAVKKYIIDTVDSTEEGGTTKVTITNKPEAPEVEKYVNNDVTADLDSFDEQFEYEIMAYVTEDGTKLTITDKLVDALEFTPKQEDIPVGDIHVYDMGDLANDHKTIVGEEGTEITPDTATAIGQDLTVVIDNIGKEAGQKDLAGHWIKVTFKAQIKASAYNEVREFIDEKNDSTSDPKKAETVADKWENISDNGLVRIERTHDGVPNKAHYALETKNNGTYEEETNTVTVEPKTIDTTVSKTWFNPDGSDTWPEGIESVLVNVTYGKETQQLTLNADNPSQTTRKFNKLSNATFVIEEVSVNGYQSAVTGDAATGFTISNTANEFEVKVSKTDLGGNELEGADIVIKKGSEEVESWTSTTDVHVVTLEPGTYTMEEVAAPKGYERITTVIEFTVAGDGTVTVNETTVEGGLVEQKEDGTIVLLDKPIGPEIEKYVNKDVHADIVNFDSKFTYDVIAYVPMDATAIVITDPLNANLVFASTEEEIEKSAVVIPASDHTAVTGSVVADGTPVEATATISEDNVLTVRVDNIGTGEGQKNIGGQSVRITFKAQIKDEIRKMAELGVENIKDDGIVVTKLEGEAGHKAGDHTGIKNQAKYTIEIDNEGTSKAEYTDKPSNEVTVIPETAKYAGAKKWTGTEGDSWPSDVQEVKFNLVKVQETNRSVIAQVTLTKNQPTKAFPEQPKLEGVTYEVEEAAVMYYVEDSKTEATADGVTTVTITNKPERPEIEKYVNKDVHADLVEFDKEFEYDVIAYVPTDATAIEITDALNPNLHFVSKEADIAASATVITKSNHIAKDGSVVATGDPIAAANVKATIEGQNLKVRVENIGTESGKLNIGGKSVRITFKAQINDDLRTMSALDLQNVKDDGVIVSELDGEAGHKAGDHTGIKNQAKYTIEIDNNGTSKAEYKNIPSNEVTVIPETVGYSGAKAWAEGIKDDNKDNWPDDVESVTFNLVKVNGDDRDIVDTIILDKDLRQARFDLQPKLEGVTYEVEEAAVQRYVISGVESNGIPADESEQDEIDSRTLVTITNKPEEPEVEKYVNNDVTYDFDNFDQDFEYEIMAYVTEDGTTLSIKDTLVDALQFKGDGNVHVYDMGAVENNHKTTVTESGKEITPDFKSASGQNLQVDIYELANKDLQGHWIKVTFEAKIKESAYEDVKKLLDEKYAAEDKKAKDSEDKWANIKENGLVLIEKEHDGIPNKASYTLGTVNNGEYHEETNTVTVEPKLVNTNVTKTWVNADESTTWPNGVSSITVKVSYGEESEELTLTAENPTATTKNYKKLANTEFVIEEVSEVEGYVTSGASGDDESGYTITNTERDKPEIPEIEKYVDKDVHQDLVEFDKVFEYDIIAYVPKDATAIVITDPLNKNLHFVSTAPEIAASATVIDPSDHIAKTGSVVKAGEKVKATAEISDANVLTVRVDNIGTGDGQKNIGGKSVRITFKAQINESVRTMAALGVETVTTDEPVISQLDLASGNKAGNHTGIKNGASYTIEVDNAGFSRPEYTDIPTNDVTVVPETEDLTITKVWEGKKGTEAQLKAALKVQMVKDGIAVDMATQPEATITGADTDTWTVKWTGLPKLEGVTYQVAENPISGYAVSGSPAANGGTIRNTEDKPEIEKYVNKDVHQDLVEFDRDFVYDVIAYVPYDAKAIVITDELNSNLHFVSTAGDIAASATVIDPSDHIAKTGSVVAEGEPVEATASINGQNLTVRVENIGTEEGQKNIGGKSVRITFAAQINTELRTMSALDLQNVKDDGVIVTELDGEAGHKAGDHTGIKNQAKYTIEIDNSGNSKPEYKNIPTNEVTVVPETEEVTITKIWTGDTAEDRPTESAFRAALRLIRLGTGVDSVASTDDVTVEFLSNLTITDNGDNTWTAKWTDLPKLKNVKYQVAETTIPGYDTVGSPAENGGAITNAKTVPDSRNVSVTKVWDDEDNAENKRPEDVRMELLINGEPSGNVIVLDASNSWTGVFTDLPEKDAEGNVISYSVQEEYVPYYVPFVIDDTDYSYTVRNYNRPWIPDIPVTPGNTGTVTVKKTVSGSAEADKAYDIDVTFEYANDIEPYTHHLHLKPSDGAFMFEYVPAGTKVTIKEVTTGYNMTCTVNGTRATDFDVEINGLHQVVINNEKPNNPEKPSTPTKPTKPTTPTTPRKTTTPKTGDESNVLGWLGLMAAASVLMVATRKREKARK